MLALASAVHGLVTHYKREEVGPAKDARLPPGAGPEATFQFSPLRCYWRASGWDGWGVSHHEVLAAFRGDVDEANAALVTFAALPMKDKVVRLFPGPGAVRSADGKTSYPCDWQVHWTRHTMHPRGERTKSSESRTAVMTLYIARAEPLPKPDPRAARWIKELNDDSFRARENASRALAGLGDAALPALRAALDRGPSLEQRRRIERLLDRLKPIHLSRVKPPKGVRVVSLDGLMKEAESDWRSGNLGQSWLAASQFMEWAEYSEDTFPLLVEALRNDREQVRELAEKAFARLGHRGVGALARLKAAPDVRIPGARAALQKAIRAVSERGDKSAAEAYWRQNRRLRAAIAEYCRSAAK
jgi:hypothetical protein